MHFQSNQHKMKRGSLVLFLTVLLGLLRRSKGTGSGNQQCTSPNAGTVTENNFDWKYDEVVAPGQYKSIEFDDLPGFTRSVSKRNYALVTPESHVWARNPLWENAMTAHIISPAVGSNFAMYMAKMNADGRGRNPLNDGIERFIVVLNGTVSVTADAGVDKKGVILKGGDFMYLPCNISHSIATWQDKNAVLLVFERKYKVKGVVPKFHHGSIDAMPIVPAAGEVFTLRKLLPDVYDYDFNIHVMDFMPGEHLNVREVHYNQHGLLLVHGKGIYRLGDDWMPVKKGDAIWMAPYVPQWFAALGNEPARYILYKDTTEDPLHSSDI